MRRPLYKRDSSPKKIPSPRVWRDKIAKYYESGVTLAEVCKVFHMDMLTLRRELPKYTPIRSPGVRPGFKRKPYGHYPKEEVTHEPDTSYAESGPLDIESTEEEEIIKKPKPKRRIIPI